ncbi:MAG: KEOPS complex subunit Cgi121 [Methanomicrobium sp.]|nr:KEOPS complex subunit Cgi121 [Methanomicrobium sp.]
MNEKKGEAANRTGVEAERPASGFTDSGCFDTGFFNSESSYSDCEFFSVHLPGHELVCGVRGAAVEINNVSECLKKLNKIAEKNNAYIICLNKENIAGIEHIESAVFHAGRSWFIDKPISNSFEMEVLLYAGGTRQCSLAGAFGLHNGKNCLYICVCIKKETNRRLEAELNKEIDRKINREKDRRSTNKICNGDLELSFKEVDKSFMKVEDVFKQLNRFFDFSILLDSGQVVPGQISGIFGLKNLEKDETIKKFEKNECQSECEIKFENELVQEGKNFAELKKINLDKINQANNKKIVRLMKLFDISEEEIESVGIEKFTELVLERVALLDVSK